VDLDQPAGESQPLGSDMLKLKRIAIDTWRESVAYLSRDCTLYRAEEFIGLGKIEVVAGATRIPAILNIVDDPALLAPGELGLSAEAFRLLGQPPGSPVAIDHPRPVQSLDAVRAKIHGAELGGGDYDAVIGDIAAQRYSKMEIAAFL